MRPSRAAAIGSIAVAMFMLLACGQDAPSGIQPLPPLPNGPRPAPVAAAPSQAVVSPHLRRAPSADRPETVDLSRPSGSGGGGGVGPGSIWDVRPVPEPSQREAAALQDRLQRQMATTVESDEPCDQAHDMLRASADTGRGAGELPPDRELLSPCDELPESLQACMSADYFKAHAEECNRQLAEMQERGRRIAARAQRAQEAREDAER